MNCRMIHLAMLLAIVILLWGDLHQAHAATFTVTNLDDSGAGSLRQAIADANASAGADTITFTAGLTGTITLASALPIITEALTISGPGSSVLAVSGSELYRVFTIHTGVSVTISGLTMRDGYAAGNGGCIDASEDLVPRAVVVITLRDVVVTHCRADNYGGGLHLYNPSGVTLSLAQSVIYSNSAGAEGGGLSVYSEQDVALDIAQCTLHSNTAGGSSGGFQLQSGDNDATLTVMGSAIYSNTAGGAGGGFSASGALTSVDLQADVIIRNNMAASEGGGGYVDSHYGNGRTRFTVAGGSIYGNVAGGSGGGLRIKGSTMVTATVAASAFYSNTAGGSGGGLAITSGGDAAVVLNATQFYSNTATTGGMGGGGVAFEHNGVGTVTVAGSEFHHNSAWGGYGMGGGLYVGGGAKTTAALTATPIYSNTALGPGGGLAINTFSDVTATLSATPVYSNVSGVRGGGLYLGHGGSGSLTTTGSEIHHNSTQLGGGGQGGGIYMAGSDSGGSAITLRSTPVHHNRTDYDGGGVYLTALGTANFSTDSPLWGNVAVQASGGGLYVMAPESIVDLLTGAAVYANQSGNVGGGFYVDGIAGTVDLHEGVAIYDNVAGSAGGGGYVYGNAFNAVASAIYGNRARGSGGGIYVFRDHPRVQMTGTVLYDNMAGILNAGAGGALAVDSTATATIILSATQIYSNSANADGGGGVAVRAGETITATLDNVTLTSNRADAYGGALFLDSPSRQSTVRIEASTLDGNHAGYSGGGLYLASGALQINGGLIRANHTKQSGGGIYVLNGVVAALTGAHLLDNRAVDGGGIYAQGADVHFTGGCIAGNSANAVANLVDASFFPLIATGNWWGVRNGPGGAGPGLGDSVSGLVDYSNFKTAPPPGCPDLSPHVGLRKTVEGIPAPFDVVTYTLVFTNSGFGPDPAVELRDELPLQVNFLDWLQRPAGADISGDVLNWNGAVTPSDWITFTLRAVYVGGFSEVVTNTAAFTASLDVGGAQAAFGTWHHLRVAKAGLGEGTVTSMPAGLSCGAGCTTSFQPDTVVTLTATLSDTSSFGGWDGACAAAGTNPVCTLVMDASKVTTATFALNGIPLRLTKVGSGIVNISPPDVNCGVDCSGVALGYAQGVPVTLTAQAEIGFTFAGWGDACSAFGANPVCTLTMDAARDVSARFATQLVRLQVHKVGSGLVYGGAPAIDCGDTCEQQYAPGASVTLYARSQSEQVFAGWSGACTAVAPAPCVVDMTGDQVVTATFDLPGGITGAIDLEGADSTEVIVTAERFSASGWQWVANSRHIIENAAGSNPYSMLSLPPGVYRISFRDARRQHQSQYFSGIAWGAPDSAMAVTVNAGSVTGGVNAVLSPAVPPLATVTSAPGTVTFDPDTGQATVAQPWSEPADITVRYEIICPVGEALSEVYLEHGGSRYVMVPEPPGSASFVGTIPGPRRVHWAAISVTYMCGGRAKTDIIGSVQLYDPSGAIADAATGQPVQGAQVVLFRIPGWRPDVAGETRECRTVDTRNGDTWDNEPAADPHLGAALNGTIDAGLMSPAVNPQRTDAAGRYGWDVAEGCYYVLVTAAGYAEKVSPVVGVPPAVTDLDLKLTPLPQAERSLFLPIINR